MMAANEDDPAVIAYACTPAKPLARWESRRDASTLSSKGMSNRRWRDRLRIKKLVASGEPVPPQLMESLPFLTPGAKRKPRANRDALRKRENRRLVVEQHDRDRRCISENILMLLTAAAFVEDGIEEAAEAAEQEAPVGLRSHRLLRELAPDDGYIDERMAAAQVAARAAAARSREERPEDLRCPMCLDLILDT